MRKFVILLAVLVASVAAPSTASAQDDGYPGSTSTTGPQPTSLTIYLGRFDDGAVFTGEFCGFLPGTPLNVTFNGGPVGVFTVGEDGCVRLTVRVLEDGFVGLGRPAVATAGLQLAQSQPQARVSINGREFDAIRGRNSLVGTGTGANTAPRTVTLLFDLGPSGGGGLARTGAMILRWSLVGAALLAVGALVVLANRRRRPLSD